MSEENGRGPFSAPAFLAALAAAVFTGLLIASPILIYMSQGG